MPSQRTALTLDECAVATVAAFGSTGEYFGLECEWAVRPKADPNRRVDFSTVQHLSGTVLSAGGRVSIEPGGQIELSTAAHASFSDAVSAAERDTASLQLELAALGLDWDGSAVDVRRPPEIILPYDRYAAMGRFWDAGGPAGRWMMNNTSSVQVNISNDPVDPEARWRLMNTIGPILISLFANSGGSDASGQRWESLRQGIWSSMDPGRTAPVRMDVPGPEAWLEYALNADVFFIRNGDEGRGSAVAPGLPFGDWMLRGHELGWPTLDDFTYHLTTLFPPVRPKGWLEFRALDALPPAWRTAAFLTTAVATRPHVTRELLEVLPNTAGLWRTAARRGLRDARLESAARLLMDTVLRHVDDVEPSSRDLDCLLEFAARFTARSWAPSALLDAQLPIHLVAETFDELETGQTIPLRLKVARGVDTIFRIYGEHPPSMRMTKYGMGF